MLRQNSNTFFFLKKKIAVIFDSSSAGWSVGGIILETPAASRLGLGFILLFEIYIQAVA